MDEAKRPATMLEQWKKFEEYAVPTGASEAQRKGMEMCFYSGAMSMLTEASNEAMEQSTDEEGLTIVNGWYTECLQVLSKNIGIPQH